MVYSFFIAYIKVLNYGDLKQNLFSILLTIIK
jgi:hypothetical protein